MSRERKVKDDRRKKGLSIAIVLGLVFAIIYFYIALPPINLYSFEFYVALTIIIAVMALLVVIFHNRSFKNFLQTGKIFGLILIVAWGIYILMNIISLPIFHAKAYSNILGLEQGVFKEEVSQVDFDKIPVVDRDTAVKLGSRKMGEMGDLVSQYNIDGSYTQITVNGKPLRNTPLVYSGLIKWFQNKSNGIPYYISVDMVDQNVNMIKLEKPIRYSFSDKFSRDINRRIRFKYPTAIIDEINFEVDDNNRPYWVASTVKPSVGLIGGFDSNSVIVVDAVTGETNRYNVGEVPDWVDRVYSANLLMRQLNWNGKLKRGFINQYIGQKGVTQPTDGYNYMSIDNDIYMYTGITSVLQDESNIGFALINLRTKEAKFYPVSSADEKSAMESAEGAVQEKGYTATFPILINLYNRPTYFLSLKDNAGLIKTFAFIDAQNYQTVATGQTVQQALNSYDNSSTAKETDPEDLVEKTITISQIIPVTVDGNTNYFIMEKESDIIYIAPISASNRLPFIEEGEVIKIKGEDLGKQFNIVNLE
ncbi:MAG: hypothetical protein Q4E02_05410 [Lagierella massiliensis]|nr:hypothetical protein [Lagierella massiliensis]